jgi:ribosomal protein S18 acetylase RimI-like enzyme
MEHSADPSPEHRSDVGRATTGRRTSSRIAVRSATTQDHAAVVALRLALLREHADNPIHGRLRPDAPERARRLFAAQLRSNDEVIFLAERGGEVVGVLRCVQMAGIPLLTPALYGYVSSVYVIPAARRRGVLRSMLDAAVAWCRERGITELRLHNAAESPVANAAWEALGFRVAEHLRIRRLR